MNERQTNHQILSEEDQRFLRLIHDPGLREALLEHLREIGEIDAFLQAENETNLAI